MKMPLLSLAALLCAAVSALSAPPWEGPNPWTADYGAALAAAKKENKILLLNFMGNMKTNPEMDRIHHELLLDSRFYQYAKEHGILLVDIVVDAAKGKEPQYQYGSTIPKQYGVEGYPVILFATPDEKPLGQTRYIPGGFDAYKALFDTWCAKFPAEVSCAPLENR